MRLVENPRYVAKKKLRRRRRRRRVRRRKQRTRRSQYGAGLPFDRTSNREPQHGLEMPRRLTRNLTAERGLIFRITHIENLPWILDNGLHSGAGSRTDPHFVSIGNLELISARRERIVPIPPGGTLDDYVPFYFTPYSPMVYNILTGWGGVERTSPEKLVYLVSSLPNLQRDGVRFVFTDRHAYLQLAKFYSALDDLSNVDFALLRRKDFRRDPEDPDKLERYQAEALVHRRLGVESLLGIACYRAEERDMIAAEIAKRGLNILVVDRPYWFFE